MANYNSATRLHKIFTHSAIKSSSNDAKGFQVWTIVFNIGSMEDFKRNFLITKWLALLSNELLSLEELTIDKGYSSEYRSKIFPNLKQAISPLLLGQNWSATRGLLSEGVIMGLEGLKFMASQNEESEILAKDLAEVQTLVNQLSDLIKDSDISRSLRDFLLRQIQNINSAIAEYSICGSRLFKASFNDSIERNYLHDAVNTLKAKNPNIYKKFMAVSTKVFAVLILSNSCVSDIREYEENLDYLYDKTHIKEVLSYFDPSRIEENSQSDKTNIKEIKLISETTSKAIDTLKIDPPKEENGENNPSSQH